MKNIFLVRLLLLLPIVVLFVTQSYSQDKHPTGDADLTPTDIELLNNRLYQDPQFEGGPIKRNADISVKGNWFLKIKSQGQQNSCQSFAVAYALDILEQKKYHSQTYLWDALSFNRMQNLNDPDIASYNECSSSKVACSVCAEGISIVSAMAEAELDLPFEDDYISSELCGKPKPVFNLSDDSAKFKSKFIWFNKDKYPPNVNYPVVTTNVDEAVEIAKEKLSNGLPLLISIRPVAFSDYISGVHFDNQGLDNVGGWHAMAVVGYDDDKVYGSSGKKGAFKIANSWKKPDGSDWGERGYLWISYDAFKSLTRLIAFMSPDTNNKAFSWKPINIKSDGNTEKAIEPDSRIGIFQIELLQKTGSDLTVCLDANEWYPDKNPNQVILYRCQDEKKLKVKDNQKWDVRFKERKNEENFYTLKSITEQNQNKVLAIREGKLILETQNEDFDENQLWLIRTSPITKRRAIVWAGHDGEFILQGDENRLKEYTDLNASEVSIILETFNNLPRQTWNFNCLDSNNPKCVNFKKK